MVEKRCRRGEYSKGGCRECKRRKIKCDEAKPACYQCTRLSKECTYPRVGERILRVSKKVLDDKGLTIQPYEPEKKRAKTELVESGGESERSEPETTDTSVGTSVNGQSGTTASVTNISKDFYEVGDLNLIASDLNNLVNEIMYLSNFNKPVSSLEHYASDFAKSFSPFQHVPDEKVVPTNVPIDYIKVKTMEERFYLEDFYYEFALIVNPWGHHYPETNTYSIPIRDLMLIQASTAPFLMAAILAQGAKTSYEKKRLQKDNDAYHYFLATCLRLLEPEVAKCTINSLNDELGSNIEAVLLTMLLLTAANAATSTQNWRPHLRGAKSLILKAKNKQVRMSKTFILCKFWFVALEVLAGISSRLGGTLKTDAELDVVVNLDHPYEYSVLKQFGISLPNGFNTFFGYSDKCLYHLRDLMKILNKRRELGNKFVPNDTCEYLRLLAGFYQELNVEFIDKRCVLPQFPSSLNLVDVVRFNNKEFIISWMDLSQQTFCYGAIITILTRFLRIPYNSPQVQTINTKLIALVSFLQDCPGTPEQAIKNSVMMIQWPMLVAGINCMHEHEKYILMKFFRISAQLGSGSAEIALKRIVRVWEKRSMGEDIDSEEDNDLDVVSY